LLAIGQQLELLSRMYKDLILEFVDKNADTGEDDYDFASAGQGINSGPNKGKMKIWIGTWTPLNRKFLTFKVKTISRLIWSGRKR